MGGRTGEGVNSRGWGGNDFECKEAENSQEKVMGGVTNVMTRECTK